MQIFEKAGDYQAFERVLEETLQEVPMRICAFCAMPGHWHMLCWPERDGDLATFMQRLTITHVRRWQEHRHFVGLGHVYQGRYKSFAVEEDEHFLAVARYVERNALRANLVARGGMTLVESLEAVLWNRGAKGDPGCMAVGDSSRLVGASQTGPTTRRSWRRCVAACNVAALTELTSASSLPAFGGPLPIHGLGHGFFRLADHAGPLADEALGHVAEGVVRIEFTNQLGLLYGLAMATLLAVESASAACAKAKSG